MLDGGPLNHTTGRIVGAAIQVHSALGPGLLESVYETCLAFELREQGLFVQTQVPVPVVYKGISLDAGYRADMIVEHAIVVDIKSVSRIHPVHKAQVLTYLRLLDHRIGLLLNFYVPVMRDGIRRVVNHPESICIPASPLPRVSASSSDQSRTNERARPLQPGPEHRRQKTQYPPGAP